jgi:dephospho-CoA kinase
VKIAITGGMGCGKSTVINALSDLLLDYRFGSYKFASYDAEIKRMYGHDWAFRDQLRHFFGTDVKAEVASIVFNNPERLKTLIWITEPPMKAFMEMVTSNPDVVVEVPMLYQLPGYPEMFDTVLAIWCDKETQRARIKNRDGLSDEMIDRKLAIQLSADEIASKADFVIDTSDGAVDVSEQLSVALRVAELKSL